MDGTLELVFSVDLELSCPEPTPKAGTEPCPEPLTVVLSAVDGVLSVEVPVLLSVPSPKRSLVESKSFCHTYTNRADDQ
jgi:hypothetical protein